MNPHRYVISLISLLSSVSLQAQEKRITEQDLVWYGYFNTLEVNKNTFVITELDERRFLKPHKQHQFLIRTHLHFRLRNNWNISGGFTYFLQSPHDPSSITNLVIPELRPHLQFDYKQELNNRIQVNHRYRTELRFFRNTKDDHLVSGYNSNWRIRYRIGADFLLIDSNHPLKLKVSDEIHINVGGRIINNIFDQNRIYAALNYEISPALSIEVGYIYWLQQRASGKDFFSRDIVRFALQHKINLVKKQSEE